MNERERYLETILFGKPDKLHFTPGMGRKSTRERWYREGLDPDKDIREAIWEAVGIDEKPPEPAPSLGASFLMIPQFEEKVLEHKNGHYVVQDWKGNVCEISDEFDVTYLRKAIDFVTRRWIKLPVETREDWEAMKERYDPNDPERFPADFEERCAAARERDNVLQIGVSGPFWQLREWVGAEQLLMLFLTDPDWVREMIDFWTEFVSATMARVLERVDIDILALAEDMAYKGYPFISPDMTRDFLQPTYRRWVEEARAGGAQIVNMDSDGYIGDLIPVWIEAGINCCNPIEVAAGCDAVEFRERFGDKMAYVGGMDKRLIARGGEAMRGEFTRILETMVPQGGFLPTCDHGVPPDVSWPNFIEYSKLLARHTGWL